MSRASYSTVKQGHIVPATYQRNFAIDEMVAVHVPGRADCVTLNVANAGTRRQFYRRTRRDGSQMDDIEAMLSSLEDVAGPVLKDIVAGTPLTLEHKGVLAQFFGMQMLRGPAFFSAQHLNIEQFVPKALTTAHVTPLLLEQTGGDLVLARQRVVEMYRQPTQMLMTMTTVSAKVSVVLGSMRWQLLRFDEPLLAYSDQPVVVWPMSVKGYKVAPSEPTFGPLEALELRVPLSPHLVLLMTWADEPDPPDPAAADEIHAAATNALVIAQADKQWMHRVGGEPPVAAGVIRPLSSAFEDRYSADTAKSSRRRAATAAILHKVRKKRFINDIEVVTIG
jgi:hypothetical protein